MASALRGIHMYRLQLYMIWSICTGYSFTWYVPYVQVTALHVTCSICTAYSLTHDMSHMYRILSLTWYALHLHTVVAHDYISFYVTIHALHTQYMLVLTPLLRGLRFMPRRYTQTSWDRDRRRSSEVGKLHLVLECRRVRALCYDVLYELETLQTELRV